MNYNKLYNDFLREIPEAIDFCHKKENENLLDKTDGIHTFWGMAVVPYIIFAIKNNEITVLLKVFDYLERMAICEDDKVQELLDFTVLEGLVDEGGTILNQCKQYMGEKTLEHCVKVEQYFI